MELRNSANIIRLNEANVRIVCCLISNWDRKNEVEREIKCLWPIRGKNDVIFPLFIQRIFISNVNFIIWVVILRLSRINLTGFIIYVSENFESKQIPRVFHSE